MRRSILLLTMFLLVGLVLVGAPREACADCIDGCIWQAQECRSWCAPDDWGCRAACDEEKRQCFATCPP